MPNQPFRSTELILNADGSIYHLHLQPQELAPNVVLVGDPDRVETVTEHFDSIEYTRQHREFRVSTGQYRGQRVTCLSTGIGTDNIDIVLNELNALATIDFAQRVALPAQAQQSLRILRLGTCGGLQPDVKVGTLVASRYAIGADGLLNFYAENDLHTPLAQAATAFFQEKMPEVRVFPYTAESSLPMAHPAIMQGITFTANGFYAPQGRGIGAAAVVDMPTVMASFAFGGLQVLNMEMETAGILGLSALLGHRAASLSVVLANRATGVFHSDPAAAIAELIAVGLPLLV